jgi:hypothetical protein
VHLGVTSRQRRPSERIGPARGGKGVNPGGSVQGRSVRLHLAAPLEPAGEQPADERPEAAQRSQWRQLGDLLSLRA